MPAWWGRLLLLLVIGYCPLAAAALPVPPLQARVTDLTQSLAATDIAALENDVKDFEARSGGQLAILIVPTTQPESIEQFSLRVVESWKLGFQGKDNGLLLLVAKQDRKLRIEVGYGLEGTIPDAIARRVVDETIAPRFKAGDFAGGLQAGVQRLTALAASPAAAPPAAEAASAAERRPDDLYALPPWLIVGLIAVGTLLRWLLGPLFGASVMAGAVGGGAWFVSGQDMLATLGAAGVAFIFVLVGLANWLTLVAHGAARGRGGGGGFSGGGGGFGGGGASGRW